MKSLLLCFRSTTDFICLPSLFVYLETNPGIFGFNAMLIPFCEAIVGNLSPFEILNFETNSPKSGQKLVLPDSDCSSRRPPLGQEICDHFATSWTLFHPSIELT